MRYSYLLLTALLGAAGAAHAQVTVDLQALKPLEGANHTTKPPPHVASKPSHRKVAVAKKPVPHEEAAKEPEQPPAPAPATASAPAPAPAPAPPPATLPTAPPPVVAIAPVPPPPPSAEPPAPPAPPISTSAASSASNTGTGLRVTFGAGQSDLSPASAAAIKGIVASAPSGDGTTFNVVAYAAGTPEDPSTARRLSLSRALAVRSALMADGISSSRIYVRALGAEGGNEAPDRVDVAVMGANAPNASPASSPAPANAGPKSQQQ